MTLLSFYYYLFLVGQVFIAEIIVSNSMTTVVMRDNHFSLTHTAIIITNSHYIHMNKLNLGGVVKVAWDGMVGNCLQKEDLRASFVLWFCAYRLVYM